MRSEHAATELKQYFQIKNDLLVAFRAGNKEDAEFHIGELAAIRLHTTNERLRGACSATIAELGDTEVYAA